jgi:hypothetical protein
MLSLENESVQTSSFINSKKVASVVTVAACLAVAGVVVSESQTQKSGPKLALVNIPEEFSGTFTNNHDDGRYVVEGVFHKFEHADGDWQIDGKFTAKGDAQSHQTYMTYTLKDDIFIEETFNLTNDERVAIHCMEPQGFPTYGQGKEIFKKAVAVNDFELVEKSRAKAAEHCEVGAELAVVNENGKPWVICGDYSNNNFEMTLMSKYITLHAKAVEGMVVDIEYPEDYDMNQHNCTDRQDPVVHFNDWMLKGNDFEHRALDVKQTEWPFQQNKQEQEESRNLQYYVCPAGTHKRCFVFHGVANAGMNWWDPNVANRNVQIRDVVYDIGGGEPNGWGGYPEGYDGIPQLNRPNGSKPKRNKGSVYGMMNFNFQVMHPCTYSYFMDTETQLRGFSDDGTHIEYNSALYSTGLMSINEGSNAGRCSHLLHVITHSMGGMLMQMGIMTGNIMRKGFKWGQAQNPWYGSVASNTGSTLCNWSRWLNHPIIAAIVIAIAVLCVGAIIAICTATPGGFVVVAAVLGVLALGSIALTILALTVAIVGGYFGNKAAIKREICVAGSYLGKLPGLGANRAYPLPANVSIEFHRPIKFDNSGTYKKATEFDTEGATPMATTSAPFSVYLMNQNRNRARRAPNWRLCGNHPWGFATDYEANLPFKIASGKLERIHYEIKKKFDLTSGGTPYRREWENPRAYAKKTGTVLNENGNAIYTLMTTPRWGNDYLYTRDPYHDWFYNGNCLTEGKGRWSDGAVDMSNCMHYALYTYDDDAWRREEFLEDNLHVSAANHDSGTCRSGQATAYVMDPCQRWEQFFVGNTYAATYHQMFSFINGFWNGPNVAIPTLPPTYNPTISPKNQNYVAGGQPIPVGNIYNTAAVPAVITYGSGGNAGPAPPQAALIGKGGGFVASEIPTGKWLSPAEEDVFETVGVLGLLEMPQAQAQAGPFLVGPSKGGKGGKAPVAAVSSTKMVHSYAAPSKVSSWELQSKTVRADPRGSKFAFADVEMAKARAPAKRK